MRPTPRLAARPGMTSRATRRFWKLYESLPEPVQTAILIMEEKGTPCKCQSSLLTHLGRAGKGCP